MSVTTFNRDGYSYCRARTYSFTADTDHITSNDYTGSTWPVVSLATDFSATYPIAPNGAADDLTFTVDNNSVDSEAD